MNLVVTSLMGRGSLVRTCFKTIDDFVLAKTVRILVSLF